MRWGLAGVISLTLSAVLSVRLLRNIYYEGFLMGHIALIL